MPSGPRIRANNVYGIVSDAPLTSGATTFNSISLPLLPVVASAHAVVVLDPKRVHGDPEIVVVTTHTAASTVATILRGQYGTSPRQHPQGTVWSHVPIDEDWTEILTSSTRPSDPYRGQQIFEYDTNRFVGRSTADIWQQTGFFFDPPHCALAQASALTHTATSAWQLVSGWDTELEDTAAMHGSINSSRITVPIAGLYLLTTNIAFATNGTGARAVGFRKNGVGTSPNILGRHITGTANTLVETTPSTASVVKLAANDYVEVMAYQNSGGNLNYTTIIGEFTLSFTVTWIGRGNVL